ncbi:hypothetical protein D3C80_1010120 [compost metagenome]
MTGAESFASRTKSNAIPVSLANNGSAKVSGKLRFKMRCGKTVSVTPLFPLEALIQSRASCRFTPWALRAVKPSATEHKFTAKSMLFTALTEKPAPEPPTCLISLPKACIAGSAFSKAAASPPTMTVKVAVSAPMV